MEEFDPSSSMPPDDSIVSVLFSMFGLFFFAAPLLIILQIALAVHVVKTGRPYFWIYILIFFPFVGCLVYLFAEVLPGFHAAGGMRNLLWRLKGKAGRLKILRERVEDSETVENKIILAAELSRQGRHSEAVGILHECASGVFHDDAYVLMEYAAALAGDKQWAKARETLARIQTRDKPLVMRSKHLAAQCLSELGDRPAATVIWRELEPFRYSEEAAYNLAVSDLDAGNAAGAVNRLEDILKRYRKGTTLWRRDQKLWFKSATAKLKEARRRITR